MISFTDVSSRIILGDAYNVLLDYPKDTAQLVFTSPPYYNAKPDCYSSDTYSDYLEMLKLVFGTAIEFCLKVDFW